MEDGRGTTGTGAVTPLEVRDHADGVRQLLLCDPRDRNAINAALRGALRRALEAGLADPSVRVFVIGGAGRNFSAGGDLASISATRDVQATHALMAAVGEVAQLIGGCRKPLVAAVTGHCIGAGAGLALLCDTVVMGATATMGFPFLKLGLVPDFGVSRTLVGRIGIAAARQALLYARTYVAPEALRIGLADEVVDDERVHARALELAAILAHMPAHALGLTKGMLQRTQASLDEGLRDEALNQSLCMGSPDMQEGVAAFKEKRAARFVRPRPLTDDPA